MSLALYYAAAFLPVIIILAIVTGKYLKSRRTQPDPHDWVKVCQHSNPTFGRARVKPPVDRFTPRPPSPAPMSGRTTDYSQRNYADDFALQQAMYNSHSSSSSDCSPSSDSGSSYDSGSSSSSDSGGSCGGSD